MDDDDEFGDLYTDVLEPFKSQSSPPPSRPHRPIDLNLRSQDHDSFSPDGSAAISRVLVNQAPKLPVTPSRDATYQGIGTAGGDKDMKFDIEEGDTDSEPVIPGLSVAEPGAESLPALATDRGILQGSTGIEKGGDGTVGGGDWDSDSEDDLQIVLNDGSRNGMVGAERRARVGDNEDEEDDDDDDDEDDEEPLVIVADTDPNQALEEQLWGEDGLQAADGEGKDAGEAGKPSGTGAAAAPKIGYSSHGYHPFHSQFKYVRPGAAPMPGGAASGSGVPSGQIRPPGNVGPVAGRGRGDWRPLGMKNASANQKGFHQGFGPPWGSNTAGRGFGLGLDFTLPSHKTIFEVDIDGFEEKPWKYPGVDVTDFFNFGLNEESWKEYCKQLEQHRIETTMQSRIRVYESGRTDQGFDPDLPPELAAATGAQGIPAASSNHVKPDSGQVDSAKGPAHVRPPLPPGRPIPVESGSGERLPSVDTRAPRIRDADAIIEIVCQDSHGDESSTGNGVDQVDDSLPGENLPADTGYADVGRADTGSPHRASTPDEPGERLLDKQEDDTCENTAGRHSLPSSSPVGDRDTRSSSLDRKDAGAEASKGSEMEEHKMNSGVPLSVMQDEDGQESKTERSSESSKARSGSQRDHQQLKDSAEEEVIQDRHYVRPASNRKHLDENLQHQRRKNHDGRQEMERTRVAIRGGRENSYPHTEFDPSYAHSYMRGEDFDKRKEREVAGGVWRRREEDAYSRRSGDGGSRKRDRGDDLGSRHRGKMRESEIRSKDDHVPSSRKQLDDGGLRVQSDKDFGSRHKEKDDSLRSNYEVAEDSCSKRRKDEGYLRRGRTEKNEILHGQRESNSRLKREREDRLEHQKREVQQKIRDDFDDHHSFWHRDEFYAQRDGNEREREREEWDNMKQTHEEGLSVRGRERQAALRSQRGSEDRVSRTKDEYKASDKDYTARHSKQQKRRENVNEESSSHHRGHEDASARSNQIVNNEKKLRQERDSTRSDKVVDVSDSQRLPEKRHKESRRKNKEHGLGDPTNLGLLRSKQDEQNGDFDGMAFKGTNEFGISRNEVPLQPNSARKRKEDGSSDDEQQDSRRGRSKLERWTSHKERDYTIPTKSSLSSRFQGVDKHTNGGSAETGKPAHDSVGKQRDVTEEKSGNELVESKDGGKKQSGERHLDTVEKLKKRSERFKLPMPNDKDALTVKKTENEVLPSTKKEGPADSEVKLERPARKRRWTSS